MVDMKKKFFLKSREDLYEIEKSAKNASRGQHYFCNSLLYFASRYADFLIQIAGLFMQCEFLLVLLMW